MIEILELLEVIQKDDGKTDVLAKKKDGSKILFGNCTISKWGGSSHSPGRFTVVFDYTKYR